MSDQDGSKPTHRWPEAWKIGDWVLSRASGAAALLGGVLWLWSYLSQSLAPLWILALAVLLIVAPLTPLAIRQYRNLFLAKDADQRLVLDPFAERRLVLLTDRLHQLSDSRIDAFGGRLDTLSETVRALAQQIVSIDNTLTPKNQGILGRLPMEQRLQYVESFGREIEWTASAVEKLWERVKVLSFASFEFRYRRFQKLERRFQKLLDAGEPTAELAGVANEGLRETEMAGRLAQPFNAHVAGKFLVSPSSTDLDALMETHSPLAFPSRFFSSPEAAIGWTELSRRDAYIIQLFWYRCRMIEETINDIPFLFEDKLRDSTVDE